MAHGKWSEATQSMAWRIRPVWVWASWTHRSIGLDERSNCGLLERGAGMLDPPRLCHPATIALPTMATIQRIRSHGCVINGAMRASMTLPGETELTRSERGTMGVRSHPLRPSLGLRFGATWRQYRTERAGSAVIVRTQSQSCKH